MVYYVDWNCRITEGEEIGHSDSNHTPKVAIKTTSDIIVAERDRVFIKKINAHLFALNKLNEQLNAANKRVVEAMSELANLHEDEQKKGTGE